MDKNLNKTAKVRPFKLSAVTDLIQAGLRCEHPKVWLLLVRSLAKGEPVTRGCIASGLKMSASDVQLALDSFADLVYDSAGNIVACGLSLVPTPHSFTVGNRQLYTWCALDALMYPVALEQTVQVMSHCPVSGTVVRLTVTASGISLLSPEEAVVSMVIPTAERGCCNVRSSFCGRVHFISSPQAAASWVSDHPDAIILSVEEAWQLGCLIATSRKEQAGWV